MTMNFSVNNFVCHPQDSNICIQTLSLVAPLIVNSSVRREIVSPGESLCITLR